MTDPMRDTIATELALLERRVPVPARPFGFGHDLYCERDLTTDMRELDGVAQPDLFLALAIRRRLDCPRGALPDDPDYGIDLRSYLNRGTAASDVRALAGRIRQEVGKDDRVERVTVTVTPSPTGSSMAVSLRVVPADPLLDDFELVLAVTTAQVLLEQMRGAR